MSHTPNYKNDDNECSGPRPPVPGEESRTRKMTEGISVSSKNSPPSYLNWARTLSHLLEDRDGVELFKKYVEEESPIYNDYLNFYFACEGLKQQNDPERVKQIIGAIYRFLRKSQLPVSEELRRTVKAGLKNEIQLNSTIYDSMQKNVENTIREKIYPNFLCSEMYINYIQQMSALQERFSGGPGSGGSSSSTNVSSSTTSTSAVGATGSGGISGASSGAVAVGSSILLSAAAIGNYVVTTTSSSSSTTGGNINVGNSSSSTGGSSSNIGGGGIGTMSSTGGGFYGPSTSASSSGSISATDTLPRSSTLPTLHEDTELSMCDDFENLRISSIETNSASMRGNNLSSNTADIPMRLTKDLLLATQKRRLEIRPPGAHGYVYNSNLQTSYNPCSRVDSERGSVSSGGRTDSDTMSLSSCSMDGRPYVQRRHNTSESKAIRQSALANKETNSFQVIPRTQRLHSNEHRPLKEDELIALLIPKLEEVKRKQDIEERARSERFLDNQSPLPISSSGIGPGGERTSDRELAEAIRQKFGIEEDNDQDILDQHVSRVWKDLTPHRSPGTMSPCPPLPSRRRTTTQDSGMLSDGATSIGGHSMRHSKSMPDHSSSSRKLTNKWPSMNTDSGISLFSADTLMKYKDTSSRPGSSTAFQLEEAKRRLEDETRRSSRRYSQQQQQQQLQHISSSSSTSSSSIHHLAPPPLPAKPHETTTVVFIFCDEEFPYRTKIPGTQPTLKQFKDYLPKKGNFRFFFKTHCEDPDSPVIQEEIVNDSDILPLFEGKVMGLVKPSD